MTDIIIGALILGVLGIRRLDKKWKKEWQEYVEEST